MPKPPVRTAPKARLSDAELAGRDDVRMWPGRDVEVNGNRVHIRTTPTDAPSAEPALFVHGLGGASHNWTDFAGLLRNHLAIEAIDLPGHGRSGPAKGKNYTPQAHADTVIAYLDAQADPPVHLVANSMGGAISILVAVRRPDLVRTLTLISPAVPDNRLRIYPLRSDRRMAALVLPVLGEWAVKRFNARYAPEVRAKGTIKLCFADPSRYPDERMQEAVDELRARLDLPWADSAVLRSMRGLARSQLLRNRSGWAAIRKIAAPTLVLWGDTDRLVAPDLAPYVAAAIPESRLLVMDDIGHTAMMEDPEGSARALLGLVEDAAAVRS